MYRILRVLAFFIARLSSRLELVGLENLPDKPPYLLVTNHLSAFDSPLILFVLPHKIRPLVASKHRSNPLYAPILEAGGTVWVRRGEVDRQALREALAVLTRGEVLGVAPEGTRARESHALQEGKAGAAYLATRADVAIVPVGIAGTEKIARNLLRLRRTRVRMVFGKPFRLPESGHVRTQKLQEYTELIMYRIAELLPEAYRGVYA
ncbi:MAG: lysophospholipid acyltransferase family protein [Anaerolineae bacterium]|jgi:1-acyl-sn-glycerol-3-phosphate acyltransferase